MNYLKVACVALTLPLMFVLFCREGDCQRAEKKKMMNKKISNVQTGTWGGKHIGLEVTADGATVDYDCAHGTIDQPIVLDKSGHFQAKGTHFMEHPGPERVGQEDKGHHARYTGRVDGNSMTLTVRLADTDEVIGAFTVMHGKMPQVMKCL